MADADDTTSIRPSFGCVHLLPPEAIAAANAKFRNMIRAELAASADPRAAASFARWVALRSDDALARTAVSLRFDSDAD